MNPFFASSFLGRAREIRRIVSRITSGGQSVAVTGEQRMGKSLLLRYLADPALCCQHYGELAGRLLFKYIDAQTFTANFTPAQFWRLALTPLCEKLTEIGSPALSSAYATCEYEGFGVFGLERVLAQLKAVDWRLVLLLDEFDNLLNHPMLHKSEFYGGLRSLAMRYESLALVTASRQSLEALNSATQEYSRLGSPYFNFMYPLALGALSDTDFRALLQRGDEHFSKADQDYLLYLAGGHPFLLQTAACALWEAYEDGENNRQMRWESAARDLLDAARPVLLDTWHGWSPETRKAVTIIALDSLPRLVSGKEFDINALLAAIPAYSPEVDELKKRGFLATDAETRSGFRLQAQVMLWWLAGELIRVTRPNEGEDLGEWLRKQEWEGLLKGDEKAQFKKALTALGGLLKTGSEAFIKASAEGFAKGLTGVK